MEKIIDCYITETYDLYYKWKLIMDLHTVV